MNAVRGLVAIACCAAVWAALPADRALAQQGSAVLFGTVDNVDGGAAVANAVVTVTGRNLPGEEIAVTDASGNYRIAGLPPGPYSMNIQGDGFKPYNREGINLHADASTRLNASLLPETLEAEEVVVEARTPAVDVGSSSTGLTITSELTDNVPLSAPNARGGAQRSYESVLDVVPGTSPDPFGVSAMGASSPENGYLLDGISVNNPAYGLLGTPLTMEFIDEVSVITGGYMPEYGQSTGAIVNAITKSGSNEYHGSVWGNWAPGALAASPKRVSVAGQTIETTVRLKNIGDVGGEVGGPIIEDRLWFYGGFQWARTSYDLIRKLRRTRLDGDGNPITDEDGNPQTRMIPGSKETFTAQQDMMQAIGKLTLAANNNNRLELTYSGVYPISGGSGNYGINPLTGVPEIGTDTNALGFQNTLAGEYSALAHEYLGDSSNITAKLSSEVNDNTRVDTWVGWHREHTGRLPADGSHIGDSDGYAGQSNIWYVLPHDLTDFDMFADVDACNQPGECPVSDYRIGGPEYINRMTMDRLQARSILSRTFRALGHHTFKTGLNAELINYKHKKGYSGGRSVMEQDGYWLDGRVLGYLTGPEQPVQLPYLRNKSKSFTIGGFAQNSWSIVDQVTLNLGLRYDSQLMYANNQLAMALNNQWSPRGGLIWDPTNDGRARVFTNYARYYEKVPLTMLDRYLTGEPLLFAGRDPGVCDWGQDPNDCLTPEALLPFGSPPNSYYIPVGAATVPVDPDIKAPSTDEFVLGGEYEVYKDMVVGLTYTKRWLNRTIEDMSRDEANTYFFGNPGYGIASDFPKAERKYDALMLTLNKTFSDGWIANASYTASWLRGNYGGLFRFEDLQFDPHQNSDFDLQSLTENRNGWLPGDHRHAIKAFGAKSFKLWNAGYITPGGSWRAYSGIPSNYLGAHPLYGSQQVFILERGSAERLPWNYSLDVRLAYTYKLDEHRTLSLTMDVFNLFNFQNGVRRDETYTEAAVEPVTDGGLDELTYTDGTAFDEADVNPNFGRVVRYQQPRTFRFGVKGTF